jgi:hypothetical protein
LLRRQPQALLAKTHQWHFIHCFTGPSRLPSAGGIKDEHCFTRSLDEIPHHSPDDKSIHGVRSCSASGSEHSREDVALEFQVINMQVFAIPGIVVSHTQGPGCVIHHLVQRELVHIARVFFLHLDTCAAALKTSYQMTDAKRARHKKLRRAWRDAARSLHLIRNTDRLSSATPPQQQHSLLWNRLATKIHTIKKAMHILRH